MQAIINQLMPEIMAFAGLLISSFLAWLGLMLRKKLGLEAEEVKKVLESFDRQALHKAFETAAALAKSKGLVGGNAIDFMLTYVFKSTPDAITGLKATSGTLRDLAEAKIQEVAEKSFDELAKSQGIPPELLRGAIEAIVPSRRR